jgi:hypothetical protein
MRFSIKDRLSIEALDFILERIGDEILEGFTVDEILARFTVDEILASIDVDVILRGFTVDEIATGLSSEQRKQIQRLLEQ